MKKEYLKVALIMLPILVLFYLLNVYTLFSKDDLIYKFICRTDLSLGFDELSVKVQSISDILQSQYNHYHTWCGRVLIHSLSQYFSAIAGKSLFNVFNVVMYVIFIYLTIAIVDRSLVKNMYAWGIASICAILILPSSESFFCIVAYAINYLWGLTFCLSFIYIWKYYNFRSKILTAILFVLCFCFGWSQELFALPIAGALCLYYLLNRREIFTQRCLLSFAFCLGCLMLVIAPGNYNRGGGLLTLYGIMRNVIQLLISHRSILLLIIVSIFIVLHFNFRRVLEYVKNVSFYASIFIFSVLLLIVFPNNGSRMYMGLVYWWLIILSFILLDNVKFNRFFKMSFYVLYSVLIIFLCGGVYYVHMTYNYTTNLISRYMKSESGIVYMPEFQIPHMYKYLCSDPRLDRLHYSILYSNGAKPLIIVNEENRSKFENIENLYTTENEIDGGAGFYRTGNFEMYVFRGEEIPFDKFEVTFSSAIEPETLKRKLHEIRNPDKYQPYSKIINANDIIWITYNGHKFGVVYIRANYSTRKVLSIKPYSES